MVPATALAKDSPSTILMVDGMPANLGVLHHMLTPEGFELYAATSGEQGLEICAALRPDLVLLDVNMPGLDGFEVCRRIKANPDTSAIPVIFITAHDQADDVVRGFQVGAVDYLSKPVRQEELLVRVRTQLQLRRFARAREEQAEHLRAILNNMVEGVVIADAHGRIEFGNPASQHASRLPDGLLNCPGVHGLEFRRSDGSAEAMELTVAPMFGAQPGYVGLFKQVAVQPTSLTSHDIDPLTGLTSRRGFDRSLAACTTLAQQQGLDVTMLLADVDGFSLYNQRHGRQGGDAALQTLALGLQRRCEPSPYCLARFAGDQFALLFLSHGPSAAEAAALARIGEADLGLSLSIGLARNAGAEPAALVASAQAALQRAKKLGAANCCITVNEGAAE